MTPPEPDERRSASSIPAVGEGPSVARMYDRLLGGAHNFEPDRVQVDALAEAYPMMATLVQANRSFLRHAVEHAIASGIRQFLDLGSGIPTVGNTHEIAHRHDPTARIAYVDHEPTAVAHSATMLDDVEHATITEADLTDATGVLTAPGVAGLLDLTQPVALLALSVLHFVDDDPAGLAGPGAVVGAYRHALAPGSLLALSHTSGDYPEHPDLVSARREIVALYRATGEHVHDRSRDDIRAIATSAGFTVGADWPADLSRWAPGGHDGSPLGAYALITDPLR